MAYTAIDRIWKDGYNKIMSNEVTRKEQILWITEAATEIRNMPADELIKREFLYIPNDIYMLHFFGSEIAEYKYGVYRNDSCNLYKRLIFPIRGFNNQVAGLGGWSCDSEWKYVYSPDTMWDKSRYFYIAHDDFVGALNDDYLFIVDGIFDSISLSSLGIHSASLMGSNLSNWHLYYLRLFKYVIVVPDNDNAGVSLVKKIKKHRPDCIVLWQGKCKDIDDYIKSRDTSKLIEQCNDLELLQIMNRVVI
jgi:hypothetical protein